LSRRAALLLLGGGAITSLGATGAFNSVSGPRRVDIGTEEDDSALLGITSGDDGDPADAPLNTGTVAFETYDEQTIEVVELANNVGEPVDITTFSLEPDPQHPNAGDLSITLESVPNSLEFGETVTVQALVTCSNVPLGASTDDIPVTLSITAEGASTSVSLDRTVTVSCRNCVTCDGDTDELVKYEWVESGEDEEDEEDGDEGDEDDEDGDDSSFEIEGTGDQHIELTSRSLDDAGEPVEACFEVDYCSVDVVVKAATSYETHEDRSQTVCVTDIDGHAISNVRFFCEAPDDVSVGNGSGPPGQGAGGSGPPGQGTGGSGPPGQGTGSSSE
jgi:hypothetical protein